MTADATYQALFDSELDVDEADLKAMVRRGEVVVDDHDVALLRYRNRVALALGPVARVTDVPAAELDPGFARWDIALLCVLHPSPGCAFRRARLTVDLRPTVSAVVRDMSPREVHGDQPLEITTTVMAIRENGRGRSSPHLVGS